MIPERQDMNELSPKTAPAFGIERISSTQHKKGEPRWSLVVSLKRGTGKGEVARIHRVEKEEMHRERTLRRAEDPPEHSAVYRSVPA